MSPFSNSKQKQLPHGLLIQYVSKDDVQFLYDEIWRDGSYLQHGVAIGPGDTVIDVGANIGLFALQAARECPGGRVLAFEPIPRVFEALQQNVAVNAQGPSFAKVKVINAGLANGQRAQAEFTFYEQAAGWSTMCEDKAEVEAAMDIFLSRALATGEGLGNNKMAPIGKWLQQRAPPAIFKQLARLYVGRMIRKATKVTCPLYTLSQVLKAHGISRVDLLKIDVERAELEVLNGIEQSDWSKIKQVVMEVHDTDKRLEKVALLLRSAGLEDMVIQQSQSLKDSTLYNVYAKRPVKSASRQ